MHKHTCAYTDTHTHTHTTHTHTHVHAHAHTLTNIHTDLHIHYVHVAMHIRMYAYGLDETCIWSFFKYIFSGSQRFMNTCEITQYADDLTVGAITGKHLY